MFSCHSIQQDQNASHSIPHHLCIIYEEVPCQSIKEFFYKIKGDITIVLPQNMRKSLEYELSNMQGAVYWNNINDISSMVGTRKLAEIINYSNSIANWQFSVLQNATKSLSTSTILDQYRDPLVFSIQDNLYSILKLIHICLYYIQDPTFTSVSIISRKRYDARFSFFKAHLNKQSSRSEIHWFYYDANKIQAIIPASRTHWYICKRAFTSLSILRPWLIIQRGGNYLYKLARAFAIIAAHRPRILIKNSVKSFRKLSSHFYIHFRSAIILIGNACREITATEASIADLFDSNIYRAQNRVTPQWPPGVFGVVSNWNKRCYHTNEASLRILNRIREHFPCVVIDPHFRCADTSGHFQQILSSSSSNAVREDLYYWNEKTLLLNEIRECCFSNEFLLLFSKSWKSLCKKFKGDSSLKPCLPAELLNYSTSIPVLRSFFDAIGLALAFKNYFSRNELKGLLFIGSEHDIFSRLLIQSANAQNIPTYSYHYLINSGNPLFRMPLCQHVLVSDTSMAYSIAEQYPNINGRISLVGSHLVDSVRIASISTEEVRYNKTCDCLVLYAAQPMGRHSYETFARLIRALDGMDCKLYVRPHPTEVINEEFVFYGTLIEEKSAQDWVVIDHETDIDKQLLAADIVFTIYSNIGIQAAVIGKLVGSLQFPGIPIPFDLSEFGIAARLSSEIDVRQFVMDFLKDGPITKDTKSRQSKFLEQNKQLFHATIEEGIMSRLVNRPL